MDTPVQLIRGQRIRLADVGIHDACTVEVALAGVRKAHFLCLGLGGEGKLFAREYLICAKNGASPCRSILLHVSGPASAGFELHLAALPRSVTELVFLFVVGEAYGSINACADDIHEGRFSMYRENTQVAGYTFRGSDFAGEKAVILAKLYRKDHWRLGLVSSGFREGLLSCLNRFGVPGNISLGELGESEQRSSDAPEQESRRVLLPQTWPGGNMPNIPQGLTPAVGFILVETTGGTHGSGTGFVITPGGHILTCHHVIVGAKHIGICLDGAKVFRPVQFLAGDEEHDVALLWLVDGSGSRFWLPLAAPDEEVQLGEPVGLLGYPLGFELGVNVTYSTGIVNSCRKRGAVPLLQIDAGAAPGSSGGPIFRRSDGCVVGILQSGVERHGMLINLGWDIRAFWELAAPAMM